MTVPHSTYRLQFRDGMDFRRAGELVPYLARLGVSHLYASPLMTAVQGSTHGYDAIRVDEIDPALGGIKGLRALAGELHRNGIRLLLDIVPNHMAASLENPWWRSVVVWGAQSPFRAHFDIDWSERLTLPFLGKDFQEELASIRLALDPNGDALALRYHDSFYPIHPRTYRLILEGLAIEASPQADPEGRTILTSLLTSPGARAALEERLAAFSADPARIAALHDAQPWRLADWKTAGRHLSYRRFFEIAGLVGLRVEDPDVFDDSHRFILDLLREGTVDGLRIDHIDGLADPLAYLERLRAAVGPDVYIVVEKILEKTEPFAVHWPVAGTTGYEFIASLADALADEEEGGRLEDAFRPLKDEDRRDAYDGQQQAAKRQMLADNFAGEVRRLASLARSMADQSRASHTDEALSEAIRALIVALPVYRTYTTQEDGAGEHDASLLAAVRQEAGRDARPQLREAMDFITDLLLDQRKSGALDAGPQFRIRFQQLSGPIMAKALEDTLFYRENAFIALNEVGGDPGHPTGGPAAFHAAMLARQKTLPHSLSATSTHDTKRGEDARARLYTLSEAPDLWIAATRRWAALNAGFLRDHANRKVPEPDVEWLLYQSLAGAWPLGGTGDRAALCERMRSYGEKALREAKVGSNWNRPDFEYEEKVAGFIGDILAHDAFLADFSETLAPFIAAGLSNSLAQTLVKLTAPGIPDIYQGSERGDFSLVDPDNRTPLDPASLHVPEKPPASDFPAYKQWLIATVLAARNRQPAPFEGPYVPLDGGRHVLAFLRGTPEAFAITAIPRLTFGKARSELLNGPPLALPAGFAGRTLGSPLDGRALTLGAHLPLPDLFGEEPVGLLIA